MIPRVHKMNWDFKDKKKYNATVHPYVGIFTLSTIELLYLLNLETFYNTVVYKNSTVNIVHVILMYNHKITISGLSQMCCS